MKCIRDGKYTEVSVLEVFSDMNQDHPLIAMPA